MIEWHEIVIAFACYHVGNQWLAPLLSEVRDFIFTLYIKKLEEYADDHSGNTGGG